MIPELESCIFFVNSLKANRLKYDLKLYCNIRIKHIGFKNHLYYSILTQRLYIYFDIITIIELIDYR